VDKEQVCVVERRLAPQDVEHLAAYCGGVLLPPCSPRRRSKVGETLDGNVGNTGQDGGQIVADRNRHPAAGLHDGQNRRDLRPSLLATDVDPILSVMHTCT
jgi:hypothetical protein